MATKTVRLVTLGCKVNQYETQLVKEALERHGYREAGEDENADLCVLNSCSVTSNGDSRSRQVVRQLAKQHPGTQTIVMGCAATNAPDTFRALPGVAEVITDKRELPDVLQRYGVVEFPSGISRFEGRKRAFVKVQDGCILRCSYCIIPALRGKLQSRTASDIEEEVRRLVDNGHQEIVLTGVHVGHYGVESSRARSGRPPFRLWHLFRALNRIPGDWRLRLSSIEAAEINDDFLAAARDCEKLCPHFHPCLQSGSDTVLKRMRRRYSAAQFLDKLERIRERMPNPAFSTDVIVGFPGETDDEFEETLDVCRRSGFMKIHGFSFSRRAGTPAATMPGQIHGDIIQERMERLRACEAELSQAYFRTLIGTTVRVMIEGVERSDTDDTNAGRTFVRGTDARYCPVRIEAPTTTVGTMISGTVVSSSSDGLVAVL